MTKSNDWDWIDSIANNLVVVFVIVIAFLPLIATASVLTVYNADIDTSMKICIVALGIVININWIKIIN